MTGTAPSLPQGPAIVLGAGAIGRALAAQLAASGEHSAVLLTSRRPLAVPPAGTTPVQCDIADEASIAKVAASLAQPPAMVIVASGILHDEARGIVPEKSFKALDPTALAAVYAVNAIGPALVAKHFLPLFPRGARAVFAALSARVGSIGDNRLGGWHAYRASKAALNMLVRNFAIELARTHPLALAVALHPGTVASPLSAPFQRGVPAGRLFAPDHAASSLLKVIAGLTPQDSGGLFAWDGARIPE